MTDRTKSRDGTLSSGQPEHRYQFYYDADEPASLSETIVTAIADIAAVDVTDLDPLYERVDPDSLNSIFQPASDDTPRSGGEIRFVLSDYEVTVSGNGHIVIDAPTDE